ncbi:MAG: hypothetical protein ACYDA4_02660 [Ignavibacteriaceae bacterium]
MKLLYSFGLIFIIFSFIIYGCKDTVTGSQLDSTVIPASNVSYAKYIQPVFTLKCANPGCHDDGTMAAGLSLTTWTGATNPQYVTKGYPNNSILVQSIEGLSGAFPMPPVGYPVLTANQIQGVKTWIAEGAKNN